MAQRMRPYYADATFRLALQSGNWPPCGGELIGSTEALREQLSQALMREGLEFFYEDERDEASAEVVSVVAALPCGEQPPVVEVSGMVVYQATRPPKPGRVWTLGREVADWLTGVPLVTDDFTVMVGLTGLHVRESAAGEGGPLWPPPAEESEPAG